jgi:hypothetical protein
VGGGGRRVVGGPPLDGVVSLSVRRDLD